MKHHIYTFLATAALLFIAGIFSGVKGQYCVSGDCNPNTYMNSSAPNTIEYDNMVSVFHSSMAKEYDGKIKVWGQGMAYNGNGQTNNITAMQEINSTNYPGLTGTVLKFAGGSNQNNQQFLVLTTTGLFAWSGATGTVIATGIKNTTTFGAVAIGTYGVNGGATKADGLPNEVNPTDVKMMFATRAGLAIVTCSGQAWVLAQNSNAYGDGASNSTTNHALWHRVSTAANTPLNDVVAVRGAYNVFMALTANGNIYTWGTGTRTNNGSGTSDRNYATLINKPTGVTPKMIGMTYSTGGSTYYLLGTDKKLYSMGANNQRQLGDGTTNDSNAWIQVTATNTISGTTYTMGNVVWISPQEHDGNGSYAAINIIDEDGKLWAWGSNNNGMIAGNTAGTGNIDPMYMPGRITGAYNAAKLNLSDKLIAVEQGGHTTLTIKQCNIKFGYVGHKINGSMANNQASGTEPEYNYSDTAVLSICGAVSAPSVQDLKICEGTTANLANAEPSSLPTGATDINWWTDAAGTIPVSNPASVAPGTYYATYEGLTVKCPTPITVSYYTAGDAGYNSCACYNSAYTPGTGSDTKVGITLLKRANTASANWPMARKSGHIALESNSRGFVVTRLTTVQIQGQTSPTVIPASITNPQEGMMVYDTNVKCLKIYDGTSWSCFNTPACP